LANRLFRLGVGARLEARSDGSLPNKPMKLTVAFGDRSLSASRSTARATAGVSQVKAREQALQIVI